MRTRWTPSVVPGGAQGTVYIVLDGGVLRETDVSAADLETTLEDLIAAQYSDPQQIFAFNTDDAWSADVSEDVAREIQRRHDLMFEDVPSHLERFVDRHAGRERQFTLRLVR